MASGSRHYPKDQARIVSTSRAMVRREIISDVEDSEGAKDNAKVNQFTGEVGGMN